MIGSTLGQTDYRDAQPVPVVTIEWLGRVWRLSTRSLVGSDVEIDPGLIEAPQLTDEISLSPGGDVGVTVTLAVVLPAADVPQLVGLGADPEDIEIQLAWVWHRGGVLVHEWAAREIRAHGYAIEAAQGDPGQPAGYISMTVEDSPYRTDRPLARWGWEVSAETWAASPELGVRYPLILGRPAPDSETTGPPAPVLTETGTPTNDKILISVGWTQVQTVKVIASDGTTDTLSITYEEDGLGVTVATASVAGSALTDTPGTTYTTSWTAGPALAPLGGTGPLHLAAYLLALGGADIDFPAWVSLAGALDMEMGGWVNDPESRAWEVARDLLTSLPVSMRRDRDGWAPVLLDPELAAGTVTENWTSDGPWEKASSWVIQSGARIGRVAVASGAPEVTVGGSIDRDAPLPHAWVRHMPQLNETATQSAWTWRSSTAWRQAAWTARIGALGWETSAWQVPAEWGRARAGDWVYLASENRYAIVQRRTLAGGVWDYTLARPAGR